MMTTSRLQTLDQRRAAHAWAVVNSMAKQLPDDEAKKFGGHARKLPSRIMASGLGQALTFLYAKGVADELLVAIADWVLDKSQDPESRKPRPHRDALIKQIVEQPSDYLRRATAETLAYLQWLIRFAEAEGLMKETTGD
jgi:CRISPR-associated protein Cmr5